MGILDFFGKKERERKHIHSETDVVEYSDDYFDEEKLKAFQEVYVKSLVLRSLKDIHDVINEIKDGNIAIVNIKPLLNTNPAEVKRAVDQLKGLCKGMGGDIAGIGEERLIVTPSFVKIWRGKGAPF